MERRAEGGARSGAARKRFRGAGRSTRRAAATTVLAALAAGAFSLAPRDVNELVIEPELLTRLQTLAGGLHREIVLCLKGDVRGGRAIVDDFTMPVPRLSTPTRSSFDRCPRGTLASWHNHPRSIDVASTATVSAESAAESRRLCVLSETDIRTAERLRHPFVVVSVDARTWCWWGLEEVDQFAARAISPGPPSPGRIARGDRETAWARPATEEATP